MRLLVTGGRQFGKRALLERVLYEYFARHGIEDLVIVHGHNRRGADAMADQWAAKTGVRVERHPAKWEVHARAAGPIRNQEMVDTHPDECVAFPDLDSIGTWDCVEKAELAHITTRIFDPRTGKELL